MKRALLILCLAGCVPQPAELPQEAPTIRASHPEWSAKVCEAVERGLMWEGMNIDQFQCSALYGQGNALVYPDGPHHHRAADTASESKNGYMLRYEKSYVWITGFFDKGGMMVDYRKTAR